MSSKYASLDPVRQPTLTVDQVAEILGTKRSATYEAIKRGDLPSIRVGRFIVVWVADQERGRPGRRRLTVNGPGCR
jgi:excisionase family DNA binding protein